MEQIMIGMSGGIDSSVSAAVLQKEGFAPFGATLAFYRENGSFPEKDIHDAKQVCDLLHIPHEVFDFSEIFRHEVVENWITAYQKGLTPNPCVRCNQKVKFAALLERAQSMGIPYIATGHYSKIQYDNGSGRMLLYRPVDSSKDQTYVLYLLTQEQLRHIRMPLSCYTKEQVREIAAELHFTNADRPDSQDICFIPDGDYAGFIERYTGSPTKCGNYVDQNGRVLGTHKGIIHYTVGQRKGLGVAFGKPVFVTGKRLLTNEVVLGKETDLLRTEVMVNELNFIPFQTLTAPMRVEVKLRYRQQAQPAVIEQTDEGIVRIHFDAPQRAPTPGQAAVFYDGDVVVGGGTILE